MDSEYLSEASIDDDSEMEEYEERAFGKLENGCIIIRNGDGTLRCPFCIGKTLHDYKYGDLLRHASVVSQGRRGAEAAGNHRALAKFLKQNLSDLAEPRKERVVPLEQETPQIQGNDELLVWPWMGIIVNIDNGKIQKGTCVGPGDSEIKNQFAQFKPKSVHTFWNCYGHLGLAVVEFNGDIVGYGDAQDFERSFLDSGRGKRDWEQKREFRGPHDKELYGWIAGQQDYESNDRIAKHLRAKGNLRTVAQVGEESSRKQDQLFHKLQRELQDSKGQVLDLQYLVSNAENARHQAEEEKCQMEERHKQELKAVEQEAQKAIQKRNEEMQKARLELEGQMKIVQQQHRELKMQKIQSEAERKQYEIERNENDKDMQRFNQLSKLYRMQEADQINLIRKHEEENFLLLQEENRKLCNELHEQKKKLANQQKLEVQIQGLEALIASEKLKVDEDIGDDKSLKNMEEELNDLKEEMEGLQDMHTHLTYKERQLNDELQDALKEAVKMLETYGSTESIGVKRMGELNSKTWEVACKEKYARDSQGWGVHFATLFTAWEKYLRDGSWNPFKTVPIGDDKWEKQIDTKDEKLSNLCEYLGEEVYQSVVTALYELEEYNASGRYPVPAAWNFKNNRKATMKEILNYLKVLLQRNVARKKQKV